MVIRHELRAPPKTDPNVQRMSEDIGRVVLVIHELFNRNISVFRIPEGDDDAPIEDLLDHLLTVSVRCIAMVDEYADRLVNPLGALTYQVKFCSNLQSENKEGPIKKQRYL